MEYTLAAVVLILDVFAPQIADACAGERFAVCDVKKNPGEDQNVNGIVTFRQCPGEEIEINVQLTGFDCADVDTDESLHGFHVHQYGDTTGGCGSTGGHFNPKGVDHGGPTDDIRHAGDFGNLRQTADGNIFTTFTDKFATLFGDDTIVGRAIVVHAGVDDLGRGGNEGSRANGNAGARLACCVIGVAKALD